MKRIDRLIPARLTQLPAFFGILNMTPDSFSESGVRKTEDDAVRLAGRMLDLGACALDIGGESTRPGFTPVSESEELSRVIPALKAIRAMYPDAILSVDTSKPAVAEAALEADADLINDVNGLRADGMSEVICRHDAGVVIMHRGGAVPGADIVSSVGLWLKNAADRAENAGISGKRILIDPGLGFGKTFQENRILLSRAAELQRLACRPALFGPSRKSFIGRLSGEDVPADRDAATLGAVVWLANQGIPFIRIHNLQMPARFFAVYRGISTEN